MIQIWTGTNVQKSLSDARDKRESPISHNVISATVAHRTCLRKWHRGNQAKSRLWYRHLLLLNYWYVISCLKNIDLSFLPITKKHANQSLHALFPLLGICSLVPLAGRCGLWPAWVRTHRRRWERARGAGTLRLSLRSPSPPPSAVVAGEVRGRERGQGTVAKEWRQWPHVFLHRPHPPSPISSPLLPP